MKKNGEPSDREKERTDYRFRRMNEDPRSGIRRISRPILNFFLFSLLTTVFFFIFPPFSIIPIYLHRRNSNLKTTIGLCVFSTVLFTLYISFMAQHGEKKEDIGTLLVPLISFAFQSGIPGILFSEFLMKKLKVEVIIGGVALITTSLVFLGLLIQSAITGKGFEETLRSIASIEKLYDETHKKVTDDEVDVSVRPDKGRSHGKNGGDSDMRQLSYRLFSGITISLNLIFLWLIFHLLRVTGYSNWMDDLKGWRLPNSLIWVLMVAIALVVTKKDYLLYPAANLLLVLSVLYMWQGLSVLAHFFTAKSVNPILKWGAYIIAFYLLPLTALLGAFDTFFDFRRTGDDFKI